MSVLDEQDVRGVFDTIEELQRVRRRHERTIAKLRKLVQDEHDIVVAMLKTVPVKDRELRGDLLRRSMDNAHKATVRQLVRR